MKRDLPTEYVEQGLWDSQKEIEAFTARVNKQRNDLIQRCTHKNKNGLSRLRYFRAGDLFDHEYWRCEACHGGQREKPGSSS